MLDAFSGAQGGAAAIVANEAEPTGAKSAASGSAVRMVLVVVIGHVRLLWVSRRPHSTSVECGCGIVVICQIARRVRTRGAQFHSHGRLLGAAGFSYQVQSQARRNTIPAFVIAIAGESLKAIEPLQSAIPNWREI
jgi:hypothetical protein